MFSDNNRQISIYLLSFLKLSKFALPFAFVDGQIREPQFDGDPSTKAKDVEIESNDGPRSFDKFVDELLARGAK